MVKQESMFDLATAAGQDGTSATPGLEPRTEPTQTQGKVQGSRRPVAPARKEPVRLTVDPAPMAPAIDRAQIAAITAAVFAEIAQMAAQDVADRGPGATGDPEVLPASRLTHAAQQIRGLPQVQQIIHLLALGATGTDSTGANAEDDRADACETRARE